MPFSQEAQNIMNERFGCDRLLALATTDGLTPSVRAVNAFYENGAFYIITWAKSGKMKHISQNACVALCGEWFTAHGTAENCGHVQKAENAEIMSKLRTVFAEWYDNGHVNEADPDTILLRIRLTDGVLFSHGTRYDLDFPKDL